VRVWRVGGFLIDSGTWQSDDVLFGVQVVSAVWGCSSAGRAPRSQRGGQRFDPAQLHQKNQGLS
jgi:hypothetical protein